MTKDILILGNLANDGYAIAKEMRKTKRGSNVMLGVNTIDFAMSYPEWEEGTFDKTVDPYNTKHADIKNTWTPPEWIHYFTLEQSFRKKALLPNIIRAFKFINRFINKFDIVESHVPYSIITRWSKKPYVTYDAGWIRTFPQGNELIHKLARDAYSHAKKVIITNPDTFAIADSLDYINQKLEFTPFAIDTEYYKPQEYNVPYSRDNDKQMILFNPARQAWDVKRNDIMITGVAKFIKKGHDAKLYLVSWGDDLHKSQELISRLGIKDHVVWVQPVPKRQLIQLYNFSDVVLDQFTLGSWGTSTPEAMACGKPVIMFYNTHYINRCFNSLPPILNSHTPSDVCESLCILLDESVRKQIGNNSREWIKKTHSPKLVAERHLDILYENV